MHGRCPACGICKYYAAKWVQSVGSNESWTGSRVKHAYNWVHFRLVYTNGHGDLVGFVLEKRYLARLWECYYIVLQCVRHILIVLLGRCFQCILNRLGITCWVPYIVSRLFSSLELVFLLRSSGLPYSIFLVRVVVAYAGRYPCALSP